MDLPDFVEQVTEEKPNPNLQRVLIIGGDLSPTGRSLWLRDQLLGHGIHVEYRQLSGEIQGNKAQLLNLDFNEMEHRLANALIYGHSHPESLKVWDDVQTQPITRKGPKGPRNRWGGVS